MRLEISSTLLTIVLASSQQQQDLSGYAWHFTDVHLDPLYAVNSSIFHYCNGNITDNASQACGIFGNSQGNCATPRTLYDSAVEFMDTYRSDADVVLFTGDFTQAGLSSEIAVYETIAEGKSLSLLLNHTQPNSYFTHHIAWQRLADGYPSMKRIYGCVGNHDKYPGDVFPYPYDGYRVLASIWQPYLDEDAIRTVIDGGYYGMNVNSNLRVVSINTNYLSTLNPLVANTSNPAHHFGFKMMDWFKNELKNASESSTKVWILGHIPFEAWLPEHLSRYQHLISKYSHVVEGQFYGHDHEDYVRLTRDGQDQNATGVVFIGPSLTEGYPSENPGIRLYKYNTSSFSVIGARTFYTDLVQANEDKNVEWKLEYDMLEEFEMLKDLSPRSFERLYLEMLDNATMGNYDTFKKYLSLRRRKYDGPSSGPPVCDPDTAGVSCVKSYVCDVLYANLTSSVSSFCSSSSFSSSAE